MVEVAFTAEIGIPGVKGAVCDIDCIAQSEPDYPEVERVFMISKRWGGSHADGTAHLIEERTEVHCFAGNADRFVAAVADQIWTEAKGDFVRDRLAEEWRETMGPKKARAAAYRYDSNRHAGL